MCYCVFRKTCKFAITQYVIARPAHAYSLDSSGQRDRVYYNMHAWYMIMSRPVSVFARVLDSPSTSITTVSTVLSNAQESMLKAKTFKSQKENYQKVLSDFDARRVSAELYTIEIGSLGHWLPCSRKSLLQSFPTLKKSTASSILDRAGMRVVGASQTIFKSRNDPTWHSSRPLL